MSRVFQQVVRTGNRPYFDMRSSEIAGSTGPNIVVCRDGFSFSVIAGPGTYCCPRPDTAIYDRFEPQYPNIMYQVPANYPGPYTHVEVGFPNMRPTPWRLWQPYAERWGGTRTWRKVEIYPYVPVDMVWDLIKRHGGQVDPPIVKPGPAPHRGPDEKALKAAQRGLAKIAQVLHV